MKNVLAIVGPTAVGKTSLSIRLAKKFNGEIISGDSMQVYRNLDIGTAKVTTSEMDGISHHLINIRDINQRYSAAEFVKEANYWIDDILSRGKLPIIVGGTGFYIQSLVDGLNLGGDQYINNDYRHEMQLFANENGNKALWNRLNLIDNVSAQRIDVNNVRRVIRALEVYHNTGKKFSNQNNFKVDLNFKIIALNTERKVLYDRINKRVDIMFNMGLMNEVEWLFNQDKTASLPAFKGIGYREFVNYYNNNMNLDDVKELIKKDSRHYAKRQITWFKNKMNVSWYDIISDIENLKRIDNDIKRWLKVAND